MLALIVGAASLITANQAYAQTQLRSVGDTGVVPLGPNQVLRVTVAVGDTNGDGSISGSDLARVRIRRIEYDRCTPKLCVTSQNLSPVLTVSPNDAVEDGDADGADFLAWQRVIVTSTSRNVKVLGVVFDTSTQRVVSQIIVANTDGDIH
jgi:hypothetical protein